MKYLIWMIEQCSLPCLKILRLLESCGSDPERVWRLSPDEAARAGGLTPKEASAFASKGTQKAERILSMCKSMGVRVMTILDEQYPEMLKNIHEPPLVLYIRGRMPDFNSRPAIAVVGHRKPGAYGLVQARRFAGTLSRQGFIVVSGMALGIDAAAHRGALEGGSPTVAVLGTSIDRCYPKQNIGLMRDIMANGAVISEFPPRKTTYAQAFPHRNRIMSGLTLGTLVIEAPEKSGSLITADHALSQGREVFVIPGNIDDPMSKGSNELIKSGARAVTDPKDIIYEFSSSHAVELVREENEPVPEPKTERDEMTLENVYSAPPKKALELEEKYLRFLNTWNGTAHIDDIVALSGLEPAAVASMLTVLEIKNAIARHPGGFIEKLI